MPAHLFREHKWREDVVSIGEVSAAFVSEVSQGRVTEPWPAQLNKMVVNGGHDLILSIGQVVPHEVVGMANYTKNMLIGTGGKANIDLTHFIGAVHGMERMMGHTDTPVRRILNHAWETFAGALPCVFVLTVVGRVGRDTVTRGLFIGDSHDVFERAAALAREVCACCHQLQTPPTAQFYMEM